MRWRDLQLGADMSLRRTIAPTQVIMDAAELRAHSRIDITDEDDLLDSYIAAATEMLETDIQRALLTQTWRLSLDRFPSDVIELRVCPVIAVSSVTYLDGAGDTQTLATSVYTADTANEPGRITLKYGQTWPTTYLQANAVTVTFTAGYSSVLAVPELAKQAVRMLVGHWFNNRETVQDKGMTTPYGYGAIVDRLRWAGYR